MKPVKIVWGKFATIDMESDLSEALTAQDHASLVEKAKSIANPIFQLASDVFVELPPSDWGHGDVLIYLPKRGWLVRRNYVEHWYIDIGVLRKIAPGLYNWTDLWLDVVVPESAETYRLLDADEFGLALKESSVSIELAAYAMESLNDLIQLIHSGQFPVSEVRDAERFAIEYRSNR